VQEEEHVTARRSRAGVHLLRPPARRPEYAVGERACHRERAVTAPTVHHDDLAHAGCRAAASVAGKASASSSVGTTTESAADKNCNRAPPRYRLKVNAGRA